MNGFPFADLSKTAKLNTIYHQLLENKEFLMSLADQITALTEKVGTLTTAVTTLQTAIDAEQVQIAAALGLLTADNPDVAAAIVALQSATDALGAATADVASTIPDTP